MKIVDRKTFLGMSENTVFSKYSPHYFSELMIKGESWDEDFLYQKIVDAIESEDSYDFLNKIDNTAKDGSSLKMDFDCLSRDGLFDEGQLFAIWGKDDVLALIKRLKRCIKKVK